ncbi:MAG: metalloregulator ArsR/SmtB family transcription factor [Chloroflexota bacterium]
MNETQDHTATMPAPSSEAFESLLEFFKALADANRLKIVGMLATQPLTVEQLAEMLNLRPSTVSHHLSYLSHVGLVSARAESYYNVYQLEAGALEQMARQLLQRETLPAVAAEVDMQAYDRKVIRTFTHPDGRIKAFPAQRKKMEAILRYVLQAFEPGVRYSEKQVNEMLGRFHEDTASLRRDLIDYGWLERQGGGGAYWKPDSQP